MRLNSMTIYRIFWYEAEHKYCNISEKVNTNNKAEIYFSN